MMLFPTLISTGAKFACLITGFSPINVSVCKITHYLYKQTHSNRHNNHGNPLVLSFSVSHLLSTCTVLDLRFFLIKQEPYPEALNMEIKTECFNNHGSSFSKRETTGRTKLLPTDRPRKQTWL